MNIGVHVSLSGLITNSLRNNFHACWPFKEKTHGNLLLLFYFILLCFKFLIEILPRGYDLSCCKPFLFFLILIYFY